MNKLTADSFVARIDRAVSLAGTTFARGDLIPRAWLEEHLGASAESEMPEFMRALGRFKELALESLRYDLVANGSFDQRILPTSEILAGAPLRDYAHEAARIRRRLARRIEFVEEKGMSSQEMARLTDLRSIISQHLDMTRGHFEVLTRDALGTGVDPDSTTRVVAVVIGKDKA